jgi:hypothetical protein
MNTFIYLLVSTMLGILTTTIDILLFRYTVWEELHYLFFSQSPNDRLIISFIFFTGLIWAVTTDVRMRKKRTKVQT